MYCFMYLFWLFWGPMFQLPTSERHCQDTTLLDEEKLEVHSKKADMEKGYKDLTSLHLCGSKQGVAYCGIENCGLPSVRLQAPWLWRLDIGHCWLFFLERGKSVGQVTHAHRPHRPEENTNKKLIWLKTNLTKPRLRDPRWSLPSPSANWWNTSGWMALLRPGICSSPWLLRTSRTPAPESWACVLFSCSG